MADATVDLGRETSCTDSLRSGRFVTGARLVAESDYRRLTTPRGMLRGGEEEANFGLDLTERIGSVQSKSDAASLPAEIRAELMKDERHETVDVDVAMTTAGPAISFLVTIDATTAAGPFTLKISVSAVTIALLGITT